MTEGQGPELYRPIEHAEKEKFSDEQLGKLMSAAGNGVAKMITLLTMRGGNIYSKEDLHRAFIFSQGTKIGWKVNRMLPSDYCADSLAPVGLVTRKTLNSDLPVDGYQITDYGKEVGVPFCGIMLDWSVKHNISLPQLWGNTSSTSHTEQISKSSSSKEVEVKKRAPKTTLRILYELLTTPTLPIRRVDLENSLAESALTTHLNRLAKAELIEYQAREVNTPYSAYKLVSTPPTGEIPIYLTSKLLTQAVLLVFQQYPDLALTREDICKFLPETIKEHPQHKNLVKKISSILAHLKKRNYLEIKKFDSATQSEINLSSDQRIVLTELLEIMDRFQNQDPEIMTKGRKLAEEIINNSSRVSDVLKRAKEQSSFANKTPPSETMDLIKDLISSHPGITNKELQQLLEQEGKKAGNQITREYTFLLEKEGSIKTTIIGRLKKFFPKDTLK